MEDDLNGPNPPCFTPVQWHAWRKGEEELLSDPAIKPEPNGYCTHCTPWYQTMQKAAGKCLYPEVEFIEVEPGDIIGVRNRDCRGEARE